MLRDMPRGTFRDGIARRKKSGLFVQFGDFHLERIKKTVARYPFAEADEDAVVAAGNGAEHLVKVHAVDGGGDNVGMAGIRFDNNKISRKIDRDIAPEKVLDDRHFRFLPLFVSRQGVDIAIVTVGNLANLEQLQVAGQSRLGNRIALAGQIPEERFLGFYPVVFDEFADCLEASQSFFQFIYRSMRIIIHYNE